MKHLPVRTVALLGRARARQARAVRGIVAASLALLLAVVAFVVMPIGAAQAATIQTCSFANPNTGEFAKTLCVLDLSVINPAQASTPAGQDMRLEVPGGNYTFDYNVRTTGREATPTTLPTYSGAFFGNRGFYTGIAGQAAYYQVTKTPSIPRDTSMIISNVVARDRSGAVVESYALAGIDAEATDVQESLTWKFDKPARAIGPIGNACDSGFSGTGTTTVTCSSAASKVRTGAPMIAADGAKSMTMTLDGPSRQGAAFAVLMSFAQLTKKVDSRVDASDAFGVSVTAPSGVELGSANTGTTASATTGVIAIASAPTDEFTLQESSAGSTASRYTPNWACTRNSDPDPTLPSGPAGTSAKVLLGVGDFVDCTITNSARATGLVLQKHAGTPTDVNKNGIVDAGDTIPFTFTLTNSGDLPLDRFQVTDPLIGAVTCPAGPLASGASLTCTAANPYVITAADATAGKVINNSTASGRPVGSTEAVVNSGTSSTETPVKTAAPSLTLVKTATPTSVQVAGSVVNYRFTVTNTGNVPVDGIAIDETTFTGSGAVPAAVCPNIAIAPGSSVDCVATYTVTQADVNGGGVHNVAIATGNASGTPVTSPSSTADVSISAAPGIQVVKSSSLVDGMLVAGQNIEYSFVVTNTGTVTLSGVAVDETAFTGAGTPGPITCPSGSDTLAPGASETCTMDYVATQADVDSGVLLNTATASGTPPQGARITSPPSTTQSPSVRNPSLSIEKTVTPATTTIAGATVTYNFTITNTGNVSVHSVGVAEGAFSGTGAAPTVTCPAAPSTLLPGEHVDCTADYTVTQADIDAGQVSNTATASGLDTDGATVDSPPSTAVLQADPLAALALLKTASPLTADHAGETITYSFLVTNVGTVSVSGVGIAEGSFSGTGAPVAVTCAGPTTLAPGDQTTCTGAYTLTQADVDAGGIDNTAAATGTSTGGQSVVSPNSTVRVPVAADSSMTIVKSALPGTPTVGDTVSYEFLVTNTGNTTLSDLAVTEDSFSGTGTAPVIDCPASTLAVGESLTCTADYVVTQQDADRGHLDNQASASGQPPAGAPRVDAPPSANVVDIPAAPSMTLVKKVDHEVVTAQGQTVTYTYTVTNTGNVTMHGVTVTEGAFSGTGTAPTPTCPDGASIAPGQSVDCTATYTVTAADADAGWVTNTATGSALPPVGGAPVDSEPSTVTLTVPAEPGISLTKSASPATVSAIGDVITYTFVVTNTGNVTLTDLTVDEGDFSGTGTAPSIQCPDLSSLAAGDSLTCTAEYTATAADVDAGELTNTATASGLPPQGGDPITSEPSTGDVSIPAAPALTLSKTASPKSIAQVGDVVTYTFVVTNAGNVTLHDLTVDEGDFSGTGTAPSIQCPDLSSLAAGESVTCTAEYTATAADVDAGELTNTASASGTPPAGGDPVTSEASAAGVTIPAAPALELTKSAKPATIGKVGEVVTYSFVIVNTGNVTVKNLAVDEGAFSGTGTISAIDCPVTELATGEKTTCTAEYTVTAADAATGKLTNTAEATGRSPKGDAVRSSASTAAVELDVPGETKPDTGLAATGSNIAATLIVLVGGMLVLGGVLLLLQRRRRTRG